MIKIVVMVVMTSFMFIGCGQTMVAIGPCALLSNKIGSPLAYSDSDIERALNELRTDMINCERQVSIKNNRAPRLYVK